MIDFDIQVGGAKSIVLTVGDSHLIAMSDQEIADVTKATTEHVNGRALVVAADRYYDTKQAVSFAKFAGGVGVDVVMVLPPDWAASGTPKIGQMNLQRRAAPLAKKPPPLPLGEGRNRQRIAIAYLNPNSAAGSSCGSRQ